MNPEISKHLEKQYNEFLRCSEMYCNQAKRISEAVDVLHFSWIQLHEKIKNKPDSFLAMLKKKKKKGESELDFFFKTIIRRNIQSPRSDHNYKLMNHRMHEHQDANIEIRTIRDKEPDNYDTSEYICKGYQKLRDALDNSLINGFPRKVFEWKYFHDRSIDEWEGPESRTKLYETLWKVERELGIKETTREEVGEQLTMFY